MTQKVFLSRFLKSHRNAVIIGSLGTISKDLSELDNNGNKLILIRGAMGSVMGIGLGYALFSKKKVYVLIGDGAFLMKAGSMATIKKYKPKNLQVIILNNGRHESCGGQPTNFNYFWNENFCSKWFKKKDIA